jgi:quinohemoprotein amine dehydrogenase
MTDMKLRSFLATLILFVLCAVAGARGEGFAVKSELVRNTCGAGCHQIDAQGRLSRISYARKTPEGWEDTVRRMARLHGVKPSPEDARAIIHYLSENQGLTASELEKIAYVLERRITPETLPENQPVQDACMTCHSFAKIASQRRTREEWLKLKDFLLATQPTIPHQHRYVDWPALADQALAYLAERFPLETPEWQREKDKTAPGAATWVVIGHQPGKGDFFGTFSMTVRQAGGREFTEAIEFADGTKTAVTGHGRWFGPYAWRGNAQSQGGEKAREVMHLSADQQVLRGRCYTADHPEIGRDEVRYRSDGPPRILAVSPRALRRGGSAQVKIFGLNLPGNITPQQLGFGPGVTVEKVAQTSPQTIVANLRVAPDAKVGTRDVRAGTVSGQALLAIYDKVDYIRVLPEKSMARTGGEHYPKQLSQFEIHAFSRGADGVAGTADDLDLGDVKGSWKLAEAAPVHNHDDVKYSGSIDQNGLFTPAPEGPNPKRPHSTNNAGELWVEATYLPDGAAALHNRAYLLVTVPLYFANVVR